MRIAIYGNAGYSNQSALTTQLNTLHSGNPITVLATSKGGAVEQWAHAWAMSKGIPFVPMDARLSAEGFGEANARELQFLRNSNPDRVLTAGTGADITRVATKATIRGHALSQI